MSVLTEYELCTSIYGSYNNNRELKQVYRRTGL